MRLSESLIQNKIFEISNSYLSFTGKNDTWRNGISISDYQKLRMQAIQELERGISFEDREQNTESRLIQRKEIIRNTEPIENENVIDFQNIIPEKQGKNETDIMDKFAKLKDL